MTWHAGVERKRPPSGSRLPVVTASPTGCWCLAPLGWAWWGAGWAPGGPRHPRRRPGAGAWGGPGAGDRPGGEGLGRGTVQSCVVTLAAASGQQRPRTCGRGSGRRRRTHTRPSARSHGAQCAKRLAHVQRPRCRPPGRRPRRCVAGPRGKARDQTWPSPCLPRSGLGAGPGRSCSAAPAVRPSGGRPAV